MDISKRKLFHGVIRHYKPNKVIEVGSGVSSYCIMNALEMNDAETGRTASLSCIEPFPSDLLKRSGKINLITQKVQTIPFHYFNELGANDLLFIDSSHTVKPGGDVNFLILEVIPRLKSGVIIHFHDIYLPYDYQRDVLRTFLHWTETSLLHAFLIFNNKTKIIFCESMLHYDRKDALAKVFPEYNPQSDVNGLNEKIEKPFEENYRHFPSSIYLQTQ